MSDYLENLVRRGAGGWNGGGALLRPPPVPRFPWPRRAMQNPFATESELPPRDDAAEPAPPVADRPQIAVAAAAGLGAEAAQPIPIAGPESRIPTSARQPSPSPSEGMAMQVPPRATTHGLAAPAPAAGQQTPHQVTPDSPLLRSAAPGSAAPETVDASRPQSADGQFGKPVSPARRRSVLAAVAPAEALPTESSPPAGVTSEDDQAVAVSPATPAVRPAQRPVVIEPAVPPSRPAMGRRPAPTEPPEPAVEVRIGTVEVRVTAPPSPPLVRPIAAVKDFGDYQGLRSYQRREDL